MAHIQFWEKPGCSGNARQRALLAQAGHRLEVRNLLAGELGREDLLRFFGERPVADWFNRSAPAVKSGAIVPENQTADSALAMMLSNPILIRRPLMVVNGVPLVGFDVAVLESLLGPLPPVTSPMEGCRHPKDGPADRCNKRD